MLTDLLVMPGLPQDPDYSGFLKNEEGGRLWISQVFTNRVEDLDGLDYLISSPAPWEAPYQWGYGPLEARANVRYDQAKGKYVADPRPEYRAGFFASPNFWGHIHLRW